MRDVDYALAALWTGAGVCGICWGRGWAWLPGLMFLALAVGVLVDHRRREGERRRRRD